MARYFFHAEDGQCFPDETGTELPNLDAAKDTAVQYLCDSLKGRAHKLWDTGDFRIIVKDTRGLILFVVELTTHMAPAVSKPITDGT